ncbi:diacylglycerol kinase [Rhizobium sp. CSW-27]|uniref:diacylglycerol kinase n=1 Tax=Rhizobium sp. CSW-27 TaxID=2839985 RepID=UPI001C018E6F|nr:diacylglycerol kinase [Rhizobium sp. CSW-27]MBT9368997.1 diacylglycerol kinase [Rhizobium sp. CSW-27]
MSETVHHQKQRGLGHVLAAASYSVGGARRLWRETAFRHELLVYAIVNVIYLAIGASFFIFFASLLLFLVLVAMEALNTAVEEIVDRISPEFSVVARNAKDLGSFAVFCLLLANGVLFFYALWLAFFGPLQG